MKDIFYNEYEIQMEPGDCIFVYTDGVAEAANSEYELFGTERIVEALNREPEAEPEQVLHNMNEAIHAFVGDAEQFDDITMMCLHYNGPTNKA